MYVCMYIYIDTWIRTYNQYIYIVSYMYNYKHLHVLPNDSPCWEAPRSLHRSMEVLRSIRLSSFDNLATGILVYIYIQCIKWSPIIHVYIYIHQLYVYINTHIYIHTSYYSAHSYLLKSTGHSLSIKLWYPSGRINQFKPSPFPI